MVEVIKLSGWLVMVVWYKLERAQCTAKCSSYILIKKRQKITHGSVFHIFNCKMHYAFRCNSACKNIKVWMLNLQLRKIIFKLKILNFVCITSEKTVFRRKLLFKSGDSNSYPCGISEG